MNRKIRVANWVINLDNLNKEIDEYISKNNKKPYIFMCDDTVEMFWEDITEEEYPEDCRYIDINPNYLIEKQWYEEEDDSYKENYGTVGKYRDCKVYLNRELDYGEVEVR